MEFLKSNLWEIKKSTALQIFGGLLGIVHTLTYWSWLSAGKLPLQYHANPQPMCWSLFESCDWVKLLSPALMEVIFHGFGVLAILSIGVFFFTRITGLGWFMLFLVLLFKGILYIQDLRLSSNVNYAIFVLQFCYLFVPNKTNLLRWLLVSYYVASGLLKLSPNWLSGQWFVDQLHIPIKLGEWLAAVAVLAEMLAPVALFFRDLRNFLISYFVLIAYHGLMWYADSYLEPMIMLVLLQLFPLLSYEERKTEREYLYQSFIRPEPSRVWLWIGLIAFWTVQGLPYWPHHASSSLRHLEYGMALSPVAASQECEQTTFLVYQTHMEEIDVSQPTDRPTAFRCNPYLRFLDLKAVCRERANEPEFKTLMSYFQIRNLKDKAFRPAFESDDFCSDQVTFSSLSGGSNGI
ncbi:MAG: DoxX family protein [Bdellovibrionales bacterium]